MSEKPLSEDLVQIFVEMARIWMVIQDEIGAFILRDEACREWLKTHSSKSEEHMQWLIERATRVTLGILPLCSTNNVNFLLHLMAKHSNITGDPLIQNLIEEVNRRTLSQEEDEDLKS